MDSRLKGLIKYGVISKLVLKLKERVATSKIYTMIELEEKFKFRISTSPDILC